MNTAVVNQRLFSNKDLSKLFVPLIVEQILELSVGLISSIMIAAVSEAAVSGVSLVEFVMALLISIFAALATGGGRDCRAVSWKQARERGTESLQSISMVTGLPGVNRHAAYILDEEFHFTRTVWSD